MHAFSRLQTQANLAREFFRELQDFNVEFFESLYEQLRTHFEQTVLCRQGQGDHEGRQKHYTEHGIVKYYINS